MLTMADPIRHARRTAAGRPAVYCGGEVVDYRTSAIPAWRETRLDEDEHGQERRPDSLYIEATK